MFFAINFLLILHQNENNVPPLKFDTKPLTLQVLTLQVSHYVLGCGKLPQTLVAICQYSLTSTRVKVL